MPKGLPRTIGRSRSAAIERALKKAPRIEVRPLKGAKAAPAVASPAMQGAMHLLVPEVIKEAQSFQIAERPALWLLNEAATNAGSHARRFLGRAGDFIERIIPESKKPAMEMAGNRVDSHEKISHLTTIALGDTPRGSRALLQLIDALDTTHDPALLRELTETLRFIVSEGDTSRARNALWGLTRWLHSGNKEASAYLPTIYYALREALKREDRTTVVERENFEYFRHGYYRMISQPRSMDPSVLLQIGDFLLSHIVWGDLDCTPQTFGKERDLFGVVVPRELADFAYHHIIMNVNWISDDTFNRAVRIVATAMHDRSRSGYWTGLWKRLSTRTIRFHYSGYARTSLPPFIKYFLRDRIPSVEGPSPDLTTHSNLSIALRDLLAEHGVSGDPIIRGRSHCYPLPGGDQELVIKYVREGEDPAGLVRELALQHHVIEKEIPHKGQLPSPILDEAGHPILFTIDGTHQAVLFRAPAGETGYYRYLDDSTLRFREFSDGLRNGVFSIFSLAHHGLIHTVPITMFHAPTGSYTHNFKIEGIVATHTSVDRTNVDRGRYMISPDIVLGEDIRTKGMGSLKRIKEALRHGNIGASGLRDLEEVIPFAELVAHIEEYAFELRQLKELPNAEALIEGIVLGKTLFAAALFIGNRIRLDAEKLNNARNVKKEFWRDDSFLSKYRDLLIDIFAEAMAGRWNTSHLVARAILEERVDWKRLTRQLAFFVSNTHAEYVVEKHPVNEFPTFDLYGRATKILGGTHITDAEGRCLKGMGPYPEGNVDPEHGFVELGEPRGVRNIGWFNGALPVIELEKAIWSVVIEPRLHRISSFLDERYFENDTFPPFQPCVEPTEYMRYNIGRIVHINGEEWRIVEAKGGNVESNIYIIERHGDPSRERRAIKVFEDTLWLELSGSRAGRFHDKRFVPLRESIEAGNRTPYFPNAEIISRATVMMEYVDGWRPFDSSTTTLHLLDIISIAREVVEVVTDHAEHKGILLTDIGKEDIVITDEGRLVVLDHLWAEDASELPSPLGINRTYTLLIGELFGYIVDALLSRKEVSERGLTEELYDWLATQKKKGVRSKEELYAFLREAEERVRRETLKPNTRDEELTSYRLRRESDQRRSIATSVPHYYRDKEITRWFIGEEVIIEKKRWRIVEAYEYGGMSNVYRVENEAGEERILKILAPYIWNRNGDAIHSKEVLPLNSIVEKSRSFSWLPEVKRIAPYALLIEKIEGFPFHTSGELLDAEIRVVALIATLEYFIEASEEGLLLADLNSDDIIIGKDGSVTLIDIDYSRHVDLSTEEGVRRRDSLLNDRFTQIVRCLFNRGDDERERDSFMREAYALVRSFSTKEATPEDWRTLLNQILEIARKYDQ
jgi:RIO-like serine/threonine protein kinase